MANGRLGLLAAIIIPIPSHFPFSFPFPAVVLTLDFALLCDQAVVRPSFIERQSSSSSHPLFTSSLPAIHSLIPTP
jgi:hypothetical protein